jgi:hypothetical protein
MIFSHPRQSKVQNVLASTQEAVELPETAKSTRQVMAKHRHGPS